MSRLDVKATVTVSDYLTIERLVRERPSVSNLEKAVQLFPTCAIFWSTYLDFLIDSPEKAVKVAAKAVAACPQIDLWRRYLGLAKSLWRLPEIFPLYERAIAAVGIDSKSSEFWIEYLYILRALHNTQVLVQYECLENPAALPTTAILVPLSPLIPVGLTADLLDVEGLKLIDTRPSVSSIRDLFQAALHVPLDKLDTVWDEYQAFEQVIANAMVAIAQTMPTIGGLPPPAMMAGVQASKLLTEYSSRWIQSKSALKELTRIYAPINAYFAPLPLDVNSAETLKPNIIAWRRVLDFEKANPFKLPYSKLRSRIEFVLSQCLLSNVYVAEFWIEKFVWTLSDGGTEAALAVLRTATSQYLVSDVLLRLVIAYVLEETGNVTDATTVYVEALSFFSSQKKPAASLFMHYVRFACRCLGHVHARTIFLTEFLAKSIHVDARVVLSFAKLELRCLNSASNAEKVIKLGLKRFPNDAALMRFETQLVVNQLVGAAEAALTDKVPVVALPVAELYDTLNPFDLLSVGAQKEDRVDLIDVTEDAFFGGLKRPDVARMHSYRPGMDAVDDATGGVSGGVSKPLRALVDLLPNVTESTVPDTDVLLKSIQQMRLPAVLISKRFDEDPQVDQLRRQREEAKLSSGLKRLLAEEKSDDVIIKSDLLMDEERDQRAFLSALASNIHRERVSYKRHKLVSV